MTTEQNITEIDTTKPVMDDGSNVVDLDKETPEPSDEVQGDLPPQDEGRAAIYAKHAAKMQEQMPELAAETVAEDKEPEPIPDEDVTVKVNGKEKKVSKSKVEAAGGIDAYQKNAAASELLNQASAEARRLREREEQLQRREQELQFREHAQEAERDAAQKTTPAAPPDTDARKALAREYHEAMIDGDMDKADELLIRMQTAPTATVVDPEKIAERAVQRAREELTAAERKKQAEKFESERIEAVTEFETKHADLAGDPELRAMVNGKTVEIYREHPEMGPKAIVNDAIKSVRSLVTRIKDPGADDKLNAKRQLSTVRGGSARAIPRPAPPPQTNSSYVQELRKQRGLE